MATGQTRIGGQVFPYEIPDPKPASKGKQGRRKQATVDKPQSKLKQLGDSVLAELTSPTEQCSADTPSQQSL
jgi:hypothetical protein